MIMSAVNTRMHGLPALSAAYAEVLGVQLEVLQRRQTIGSMLLTLDRVRAVVEAESRTACRHRRATSSKKPGARWEPAVPNAPDATPISIGRI